MEPTEHPLTGGNVTGNLVRIGDTVRRPAGFWSESVHALLAHLHAVGFRGAPRSLGFDERGRHVLEFIEGTVPMPFRPDDPIAALHRIGAMIRDFHDAAAGFEPPADARWNVVIAPDSEELIVHHDLAPWNLVCSDTRWVLIDWDAAGPGSRLWDLAYAAHGFLPLDPSTEVDAAALRLAALADGYRLDEQGRHGLAGLLVDRIMSMYRLLEHGNRTSAQPWARLWAEGHGESWRADADYTARHLDRLVKRLVG